MRKRDEKREHKEYQDTRKDSRVSDDLQFSHSMSKCDICGSRELVIKQHEGTIVCDSCGIVQ